MNDLYLLSAFVCCIFVLVNDTWRASSQKYLEATVQSHDQSRDNNSSTGIYDACRNVARLTRPESSSIAGFLAALIALRGGCASSVIVRVGISMTLTTMAGFVIDDVHDIFQDQIAGVSTRTNRWAYVGFDCANDGIPSGSDGAVYQSGGCCPWNDHLADFCGLGSICAICAALSQAQVPVHRLAGLRTPVLRVSGGGHQSAVGVLRGCRTICLRTRTIH